MAFPRSGGQGGGKRVRISEENVIEMVERESGEVRRRRSLAEVREVGEEGRRAMRGVVRRARSVLWWVLGSRGGGGEQGRGGGARICEEELPNH